MIRKRDKWNWVRFEKWLFTYVSKIRKCSKKVGKWGRRRYDMLKISCWSGTFQWTESQFMKISKTLPCCVRILLRYGKFPAICYHCNCVESAEVFKPPTVCLPDLVWIRQFTMFTLRWLVRGMIACHCLSGQFDVCTNICG